MLAYCIKILRFDCWLNVTNNDLEKLGAAKKVSNLFAHWAPRVSLVLAVPAQLVVKELECTTKVVSTRELSRSYTNVRSAKNLTFWTLSFDLTPNVSIIQWSRTNAYSAARRSSQTLTSNVTPKVSIRGKSRTIACVAQWRSSHTLTS